MPEQDGKSLRPRLTLRRMVVGFVVVVHLILLDQIVKAAAVAVLRDSRPRVVLDNLFQLAYVENRGCAWGMFQGHVWPLAVFALIAFALLLWKRRTVFNGLTGAIAEPLLYAGIVGNLLDRLVRGFVVDMFDFHWGPHHFPCFNVADSYITVAAGLLILGSFLEGRAKKNG